MLDFLQFTISNQNNNSLAFLPTETPLGQVPILEVDGVTIGQSKNIASFLAKRFGRYLTFTRACGCDWFVSSLKSFSMREFIKFYF